MRGIFLAGLMALTPLAASAQGEPSDSAIDARLRASADAAQSLQGPLDGSWTLIGTAGARLFSFQLVDRPGGREPLEGVWRDLRHPMVPGDIGPIDSLERGARSLAIRFSVRPGEAPATVTLTSGADGGWSGELREAGAVTPVRLQR